MHNSSNLTIRLFQNDIFLTFPFWQHIPGFGTIRGIPSDSGSRGWGPHRGGRGRGRGKQFPAEPSYNKSKKLYAIYESI